MRHTMSHWRFGCSIPHAALLQNAGSNLMLSIVTINSDGASDTLKCIDSICKNPPNLPFEIILVDNYSGEDIGPFILEYSGVVRLVNAPCRQGFSKNCNLGINHARGDLLLILNNDTLIQSGTLDALLNGLFSNPGFGAVGPKIISSTGTIQVDCARKEYNFRSYVFDELVFDSGLPSGWIRNWWRRGLIARRRTGPVDAISGACILTTREKLREVGLFDEGYDFYFEDLDWCRRVREHGMANGYIADSVLVHLGDRSARNVKIWAQQSKYKGALRYLSARCGLTIAGQWLLWLVTMLVFFQRWLCFSAGNALLRRASTHSLAYWELLKWLTGHMRPPYADEESAQGGQ